MKTSNQAKAPTLSAVAPTPTATTTALKMILVSITNPITLVTIFAPILILQINYFKLRTVLSQSPYFGNQYYEDLRELVTNNKWADTLVDINIQYVVLMVAFLFTIFASVKGIYLTFCNHTLKDIVKSWENDSPALIFLIISILIVIFGSISFLTGSIITPDQIDLYKLNSENAKIIFLGIHPPPFESNIFIGRFLISIYGVYLTFFLNKRSQLIK